MKKLHRIFICFLAFTFLSMNFALCTLGTKNDADTTSFREIIPTEISVLDDDTKLFTFILDTTPDGKNYISFMSNHEEVTSIVGGNKIEHTKEDSIFGHTTGTLFHFVPVPIDTRRISIKCTDVYPGVTQADYHFYYGDGLHIVKHLFQESLTACAFSLADICLGIAMIIYWLMARAKINEKKALLDLGIFTVLMGFWTLNETNMFKLFVLDGALGSHIAFTILMIVVVPYCLFVDEFFEIKNKKISATLIGLNIANYVICTILQVANILDYKQTVTSTHVLLLLAVCFQLYALAYSYMYFGFTFKVKINIIGTLCLTGVVIFDLISYYNEVLLVNEAGRIALLIYTLTLGLAAVKETNDVLEETHKMELYKELAFMDTLTGLYNRNAYNDYLAKAVAEENNMILTFDLNELKKCNDTQGHKAGDRYIKDASDIIKRTFSELGKCYRIGGDEFCVVIKDASHLDIHSYLNEFHLKQEVYREKYPDCKMQIAVGYSVFNKSLDRDLEDTRNRADEYMYHNKINLKGSQYRP